MKKGLWLMGIVMLSHQMIHAQALTTVTDLRLWEHHSSAMNNGMQYGDNANGSKSGYDFVNRAYYNSFNTANFGAYTNGEEANIDMVEHKGVFGGPISAPKNFGFTSGVSTIWAGDIKGNGTTKWMKAPASFNYSTATDVAQVKAAYDSTIATNAIDSVEEGKVYLGRIRNTNLYVAMKTSNIHNASAPGGIKDVYFDFEYKYGTYVKTPTGISENKKNAALHIYPNPATNNLIIENKFNITFNAKLVSIYGQEIQSFSLGKNETRSVDISSISSGVYFVICESLDGIQESYKFIKH